MHRVRCAQRSFTAALCLVGWASIAHAQESFFKLPGAASSGQPTVAVTLTPADAQAGDEVTLSLSITLPEGASTYSQDPSFQKPTTITISDSLGLQPLGDGFVPDRPAERKYDPQFKKELEKFFGDVTWSRKFRVEEGASTDACYVRGQLQYLVCDDETCRPFRESFALTVTGAPVPPPEQPAPAPTASTAPTPVVYSQEIIPTSKIAGRVTDEPIKLTFELPPGAQVGETVTLTIVMTLDEGWHTFGLTKASDKQIGLPTIIKTDALHHLEPAGDFTESPPPQLYNGTDHAHFGNVTWTRPFTVTGAEYGVGGTLRYSICDAALCKRPRTIEFSLGALPAIATAAAQTPTVVNSGNGSSTGAAAAAGTSVEIARFELVEAEQSNSLAVNLLFAFLGGLILNVMPCVLPVIAIKVLSFVQQAGESRGRILALNLTYACGVISVFLSLALLAVYLGTGWGELFQNSQFNLLMAAFVFAMGLSLLGVFEIPVPGMVGSAAGGAHREGLLGAFFTGIFATLLATPCTGPFMGTTLAWSVKQSAGVVFLVWGMMGVGMASPYLVIGAFPRLVKWLPRPGMWMVRFKEFAGFVLMGAVIWLISSLHAELVIPALIMLVGIALGLWMIGNLYDTASPIKHKWTVRGFALMLSAIVIGFGWNMQFRSAHVDWEDFSTARVEQLRQEGRPILIDFTADWCPNCKTNEAIALDRPETAEYFRKHGYVAIKADYTNESPEIARWLELSNTEGIPLTLIFPKGQPDRAIPLRGVFTQGQLFDVLRRAGDASVTADAAATSVAAPAASTIPR